MNRLYDAETGYRFFCSWSGGKDSCLSLYRTLNAGNTCVSLLTMIDETGGHSRSHGLPPKALEAQAESLGLPLRIAATSRACYETLFKEQAVRFKEEQTTHGVFGDIDIEHHREWVERICIESGIKAYLPLWKENRRGLVRQFIGAGFKAIIVVVNNEKIPRRFLGRTIDLGLVGELEAIGVDACGENGEFHSFVYDGPLFKKKLSVVQDACIEKDGYTFLPLEVSL